MGLSCTGYEHAQIYFDRFGFKPHPILRVIMKVERRRTLRIPTCSVSRGSGCAARCSCLPLRPTELTCCHMVPCLRCLLARIDNGCPNCGRQPSRVDESGFLSRLYDHLRQWGPVLSSTASHTATIWTIPIHEQYVTFWLPLCYWRIYSWLWIIFHQFLTFTLFS